jgi:branched-chain amino acid transport system permease protein
MIGSLSTEVRGVAIATLVLLLSPLVLDTYSLNIFVQAFAFAIVAVTVDLLWGYTGILSYAQSTFFGIGAYAVGLAFTYLGFSLGIAAVALITAFVAAAVVSALIGWLAFHSRASWLYVAVVTFAVPVVFAQVVLSGGTITGSSSGLSGFTTLDLSFVGWYLVLGLFLIVLVGAAHRLVASDAGRLLEAIRENEERCQYLGLQTARIKIALFVVCGIIAAFAGALYAASSDVVAPGLGDFVLGTQFVIWTAVGGRGTLLGPVVATILINVISAHLSGSLPFVWTLLIGILFVVVVIYLPGGISPIVGIGARKVRGFKNGIQQAGRKQMGTTAAGGAKPVRTEIERLTRIDRAHEFGDQLALELRDVSRNFGSLNVLRGVDLQVRPGELVSIIGPNGAGKTTLMRCISDGRERSGGTIAINGRSIGHRSPQQCVRLGLGRKFQSANVFEGLTVRDCLLVARGYRERPSLWESSGTIHLPDAAIRVIEATGLDHALGVRARHLSHGMKQALELAMVLAAEPTVVLLDEPTAGLSRDERASIGLVLLDLARVHQLCLVLVEHDLEFVREISSRVIVLHQGRVLLDGSVAEVVDSNLVREVYAGTNFAGAVNVSN